MWRRFIRKKIGPYKHIPRCLLNLLLLFQSSCTIWVRRQRKGPALPTNQRLFNKGFLIASAVGMFYLSALIAISSSLRYRWSFLLLFLFFSFFSQSSHFLQGQSSAGKSTPTRFQSLWLVTKTSSYKKDSHAIWWAPGQDAGGFLIGREIDTFLWLKEEIVHKIHKDNGCEIICDMNNIMTHGTFGRVDTVEMSLISLMQLPFTTCGRKKDNLWLFFFSFLI